RQHARRRADRLGPRALLHDDPGQRRCPPLDLDDVEKEFGMISRRARRKATNFIMFALTGVCTLIAVSVLFFILGYLLWQGGHSLNWNFFTKLPAPVGETGGGFANAILGSGKILLL